MTDLQIFKNSKKMMEIKDCSYFPKVGEHILCGTDIYKIESMGLDIDANTVYAVVVIGDDDYRYLSIPKAEPK